MNLQHGRAQPSDDTDEVGRKVGRIRLQELLGIGGMGAVYVGFDEKLQRPVAVKSIRPDLHPDAERRGRLMHEARLLSRLNHPNICLIHDLVEEGDSDYLILELVDGESLRQLRGMNRLDDRAKFAVADQVAAALVAAHDEGIVHRDLKPENVMVTPRGRVKVLDFGLAQLSVRDASLAVDLDASTANDTDLETAAGPSAHLPGTLLYMSPEQIRSESVTVASDMFSFGLLLQELFTGSLPYDARLPKATLVKRIVSGETEPAEGIDPNLKALVDRLKSTTPARRPTAVDTADLLHRIRKEPRRRLRRRLLVTAVVTLFLVAMALAFLSFRVEQEKEEAERQARLATSHYLTAVAAPLRQDVSLLLAVEAFDLADTLTTRSYLLNAVNRNPRLRGFLYGHLSRVRGVSWSPDSTILASTGDDQTVRFWDAETGKPRGPPLIGHTATTWEVAWRPDSRVAVSASSDGTLRFWDVVGHRPLGEPIAAHAADVWDLAWSPDGTTLASVGEDGSFRLWDAATGELRRELRGHVGILWGVTWSPDSRRLAAGGSGETVWTWDAAGSEVLVSLHGHTGNIEVLAWSPDGGLLATGGADRRLHLWDVDAGVALGHPIIGHVGAITGLAWSPDSRILASSAADNTIRLWNVATGLEVDEPLVGHHEDITSLAWSSDGRLLASASYDRVVALWQVAEDVFFGQPLRGHSRSVSDLALSPDQSTLITVSIDGTARIWDLETGRARLLPIPSQGTSLQSVAIAPDGRQFAAGGSDSLVWLWDHANGRSWEKSLQGHEDLVSSVAWSSSGRLASGSWDRTICLWEGRRCRRLRPAEDAGWVIEVSWNGTGNRLASAHEDGSVTVWDVATALPVWRRRTHRGHARAVAWSPDGRSLASAGLDRRIILSNAATGTETGRLDGHTKGVNAVLWTADGATLVSSSADHSLVLWNVATLRPFVRIDTRSRSWKFAMIDGRILFSAEEDLVSSRDVSGHPEDWRRRACTRAGRNLTREEWRSYLGSERPYRRTCLGFPEPDPEGSLRLQDRYSSPVE